MLKRITPDKDNSADGDARAMPSWRQQRLAAQATQTPRKRLDLRVSFEIARTIPFFLILYCVLHTTYVSLKKLTCTVLSRVLKTLRKKHCFC